jgi:hypothetical protein
MYWIDLARDRNRRGAVVQTVMNLKCSAQYSKFLE